jgi:dihydrolipoamide dehydrogenase
MNFDVAVLGGGPGGYTAAIRAAQLGARVACIERAPELGGTCLRIGCIPTKAWVQTAFALKSAQETFGKLGVSLDGSRLDFARANEWKAAVVKRMTSGVAFLFKVNGVEWIKGTGTFKNANTISVGGREDVTFKSAIIATGSYSVRPPIPGLESKRCVDSEGLLAQTDVSKRLVILGGGVIGCEFASIFQRFGSTITIIEMLDSLISQEDADASKELANQFRRRGITLHLGKQCTKVEESGSELSVHLGDGEMLNADLMLVSVGRAPLVHDLGLREVGIQFDLRKGIVTDDGRRTSLPQRLRPLVTARATGSSPTPPFGKVKWRQKTLAVIMLPSATTPSHAPFRPILKLPALASLRRRRASAVGPISRSGRSLGSPTRAR